MNFGGIPLKFVNPAKDGYVSVTFLFGTAIGPFSRRLMEVMCEEGFVDEATRDKDWLQYTTLLAVRAGAAQRAQPLHRRDRQLHGRAHQG